MDEMPKTIEELEEHAKLVKLNEALRDRVASSLPKTILPVARKAIAAHVVDVLQAAPVFVYFTMLVPPFDEIRDELNDLSTNELARSLMFVRCAPPILHRKEKDARRNLEDMWDTDLNGGWQEYEEYPSDEPCPLPPRGTKPTWLTPEQLGRISDNQILCDRIELLKTDKFTEVVTGFRFHDDWYGIIIRQELS